MQKILVILGSNRPNRKSKDVADWVMQTAKGHEGFEFELADLAEINLPFLDEPNPPMMGNYQKEHTKQWSATVAAADGFIFVTPEYNHGYSPVLKNAIDYLFAEWNRKPVAFVGHGSVGGTRAIEQLKQVVIQLDMAPLNAQVDFNGWVHWDQEGNFKPDERREESLERLLKELKWWGEALKTAREKS